MTLSAQVTALALPPVVLCAVYALIVLASSAANRLAPLLGPQKPDSNQSTKPNNDEDNGINPPEAALEALVVKVATYCGRFLDEATPYTAPDAPCFEPALAWFRTLKGWDSADVEALASTVFSLLPRLAYSGPTSATSGRVETPQRQLLAQAEAVAHRPLGFASSPSLPGTISSPWWTDFAHLIYWFYFIATFATVVFLWYLYDFRVRRSEAAHPIRETRGFSRAQTGDLVTAVLPLTWSATMVMHASTHSINFDENTAGTAFSFTVVAYQWGWNYYFPRDIVTQLEAAPRIVGRGRVVSFETSPLETTQTTQWDSWALRATIGSSHGSRSGRLNTSPALPLILPTDVPAGYLTSLFGTAPLKGGQWRKALNAALSEISAAPYNPAVPEPSSAALPAPSLGLETPTLFRAKSSVFISGSRLTLVYHHLAPGLRPVSYASSSWVTADVCCSEGSDVQTRAPRSLLLAPAAIALPGLENLSSAPKGGLGPLLENPKGINLSNLRGPALTSGQRLV